MSVRGNVECVRGLGRSPATLLSGVRTVGSGHGGSSIDDDGSRGLLCLLALLLLPFLLVVFIFFELVLVVELANVVEDDEDTGELEDPDYNEDDDDNDTNDIEAFLADPVFDASEITVRAIDALIDSARVAVEEGPDEEDTEGDVDEGVDGDGVSVGDDESADLEDGSDETD